MSSVALITGGASGLGEAAAHKLASNRMNVVLFDMNEDRAKQVCEDLQRTYSVKADYALGDVTKEADVLAALEKSRPLGALRVVVNCAGIGGAIRTVNSKGVPHDFGAFQRVLSINLGGTFNVCRLAAGFMVKETPAQNPDGYRGVFINTASVAAFDGQVGQAAYSASKGAVVGMTLPMARDLAAVGIRVMCIAPGIYNTPMVAMMPEDVKAGLAADVVFPHRLGNPEEFGELVLSITNNPYLNGTTIRLDGAIRMPPRSYPIKQQSKM